MHSFSARFCILIQISVNFAYKGPIDNKAALVHVMDLCSTGNKTDFHYDVIIAMQY